MHIVIVLGITIYQIALFIVAVLCVILGFAAFSDMGKQSYKEVKKSRIMGVAFFAVAAVLTYMFRMSWR